MVDSGTTFFVGEYTHALDPKGRLTIPSKWRIPEETILIWHSHPGGYITVYPPKMVGRLEEKVAEASLAMFGRKFLMELSRKLIPLVAQAGSNQSERQTVEHAGIQGKAVLVGNFRHLRFGRREGMRSVKLLIRGIFLMR